MARGRTDAAGDAVEERRKCRRVDGIDEMDEDVYRAATSMPQSKHGMPLMFGRLSTNHKIGGIMDTALAMAAESASTAVYRWCAWEVLQSCRDYSCSTCKLSPYCPGVHMKGADGYYSIEDFISKLYNSSMSTINLEWFCIKAGRDDLIYGESYREEVNSALDLPGYDDTKKVFLGIDWGGTNPFAVGVFQKFPRLGWVMIDEVYMGNTTNSRVIVECKTRPWWRRISEGVADPSRPDLIKEWREESVDIYKAEHDISVGIEAVKDALNPVLGKPKLYINRKCRNWIREAGMYYEKNGKPVKDWDHHMDQSRYFVMRYVKEDGGPKVRSLR